jgi:transcription-repair coupling factor (superfamily II helicase)
MSDPKPRISPLQPVIPEAAGARCCWTRLYGASRSLALAAAARIAARPLLVLAPDSVRADRIVEELKFFRDPREDWPILTFPDWETLPYDVFSPYQDIVSERLETLVTLPGLRRGVLVAPLSTAMHRLPPREYLQARSLMLAVGQRIDTAAFRRQLADIGYRTVGQVAEHGDIAVRGSLIDIYPMGARQPYRLDLLDDTIESIRVFDPETQRSLERVERVRLLPAQEVPLTDDAVARFRAGWRARFPGNPMNCPVYRDVSQGLAPAGIEYYLPLFYAETHSLFDYLADDAIVVTLDGAAEAAAEFWGDVERRYEQGRHDVERPLLPPADMFFAPSDLGRRLAAFAQVHIGDLDMDQAPAAIAFATSAPLGVPVTARAADPLAPLKRFAGEFGGRLLLVAESAGRREMLIDLLRAAGLEHKLVAGWSEFLVDTCPIGLAVASIEEGAQIDAPRIAVIGEAQLFGERAQQRRLRRRAARDAEAIIRDLTELRIGAPVVHEEHGIGRYRGLVTLCVDEVPAEFICIEYAEGDKLYVPVTALDRVSRYTGIDPDHAPLHRLGSGQWERARRRAAEQVCDVAAELLELHARRAARPGLEYAVDEEGYRAFSAIFPFEETPGQLDAIAAVLGDMRADRPMDRLVCGDSGFGKTEVAMRAAFIAVCNNRQVAVLTPTTLLAQQHYHNFRDRFADWPVRVELLSRFRAGREQQEVIEGLKRGVVDIVIGTHKLLQSGIEYAHLGLVIIDEEHRFGVRQKEKIKALRANVDVLTLTATPIPRTLNLALAGLRELSIISTPPARRLAVKSFVREWDDGLIREAILRELRRGGQAYFLHNKIENIGEIARRVESLLPEARVRIAHGRMPEQELERVMLDFYHRRFNVLVCTTIIESGIDVPNANTIIVNRADKLGLAQLYQLRGRVGRSHHRAYAYLIIPPRRALAADAVKRLEAIESLEELGVGFTLATHDLEIRGAGEILGEEQSGHIQEIGFGLYMDMLERAVRALKSGRPPDLERPLDSGAEINLHIPALLPEDYLPDVHERLILYKRIAGAADEDRLADLREEIIDRFGPLPPAAQNLFRVASLKLKAKPIGIRKIDFGPKGGRLYFHAQPAVDPQRVIHLIQSQPRAYRLDGADKLRILGEYPDAAARIGQLVSVLDQLSTRDAA